MIFARGYGEVVVFCDDEFRLFAVDIIIVSAYPCPRRLPVSYNI